MPAAALAPQTWKLSLPPAGVSASLLLHAALLALIVLGQLAPPIEIPPMRSVEVDLVSLAQFAAMVQPKAVPLAPAPAAIPAPAPTAASPSSVATPAAPSSGPFRATQFYAGGLLAEPASAKLRRAMGTLDVAERAVQLCDIEAMEQIRQARPDFDPDMVVPYAMAETMVQGGTLIARGGAFRSRREWYEVSFNCAPAADLTHVETFEFTLGEAIPHELWEAHYLTAEEADE